MEKGYWYEEHPSIEENRIRQEKPIPLSQCIESFNQEEYLGDDVFCSFCQERKKAFKKMDLWRLPKVIIIHLKRFQYYNNRWRKSHRFFRKSLISGLLSILLRALI